MVYETSFLFLPTLAGDELAVQVGKLKEAVTSNGGEILSEEYPQNIALSYPIRHRLENKYVVSETAYFGWMKYELDPEKAEEVKKLIDSIKVLMRYVTLKTVKENTIVSKDVFATLQGKDVPAAPIVKEVVKRAPVDEGEMVEEEVDEELDKMLEDTSEEAESTEKEAEVEADKE
jgi:ribosomal protein S6